MKMAAFVDKSRKMCVSSIKKGVFVDKAIKISLLSMKRTIFVDESRGYLLYLYDLTENIN